VLDLVNKAYGFLGAPGVNPAHALAAPQAGLISSLAQGVIQNDPEKWQLMGYGVGIGIVCILIDAVMTRTTKSVRLPPLAVGLGIYLPTASTLMITVGALVGWWYDKRAERGPKAKVEGKKQLGVLLASGLIVGESVLGVVFSGLVVYSGNPFPIGVVGDGFYTAGLWIGGFAFAGTTYLLYRWIEKLA
jgi:putative OPT family oligopeptide transporter